MTEVVCFDKAMKYSGSYFVSSLTRAMIGKIYAYAKDGRLKVEKWVVNIMYDLPNYKGDGKDETYCEREKDTQGILNELFHYHIERAQELINETANKWYERMDEEGRAQCNRDEFVSVGKKRYSEYY